MPSDTETRIQNGLNRLDNWKRWAVGGSVRLILGHYYPPKAKVCGEYIRTTEDWHGGDEDHADPIDELDAHVVEIAILKMPAQIGHTVRYAYTGRKPVECILHLERMTRDQVRELVNQAARMLG